MNAFKHFGILLTIAAIGLLDAGCSDDDSDDDSLPVIQFSSSESTVNEDDGTVEIEVSSTKALTSDVEISFEVSGSAYLDGDYSIETPSPITLEAGSQTATIVLKIIDESIIETSDDELTIELTSVDANAQLSETDDDLEHELTIEDNDTAADDELQIDLTWDVGDDDESIDDVNLDLYFATNVVIEDDVVTSYDLYSWSDNTQGFETLRLTQDDEDTEYYIVVNYESGSKDVDFTLNFNGLGLVDESTGNTLTTEYSGSAVFLTTPIIKSGSSISFGERKASGWYSSSSFLP